MLSDTAALPGTCIVPGQYPGENNSFDVTLMGTTVRATDLGEELGSQCKRCYFLAVAASLGSCPSEMLSDMRSQASQRLSVRKASEVALEIEHIVDENAHDIVNDSHDLRRDAIIHLPQAVCRSSMVVLIGVNDRSTSFSVEILVGLQYDGSPDRRGFVLCANGHATLRVCVCQP